MEQSSADLKWPPRGKMPPCREGGKVESRTIIWPSVRPVARRKRRRAPIDTHPLTPALLVRMKKSCLPTLVSPNHQNRPAGQLHHIVVAADFNETIC